MEDWQRVVNIVAFIVVLSFFVTERRLLRYFLNVVKRFRFRMFLEVVCLLGFTGTVAITLIQLSVLNIGWANIVLGEDINISHSPISYMTQSTQWTALIGGTIFYILLIVGLPQISRFEENLFRKGKNTWKSIVIWSVLFGLMHCLAGVSVGIGIALIVPGLFFGLKYKQAFDRLCLVLDHADAEEEATQVSIVYHTLYNVLVVSGLYWLSVTLVVLDKMSSA